MAKINIDPWEPEETVGKVWHSLASRFDAPLTHAGAAVELADIERRIALLFRGLGGSHGVEIRPVSETQSQHRVRLLRRLGTTTEYVPQGSFDNEVLRLPVALAIFPTPEDNFALYVWLAAMAAHAPQFDHVKDPFKSDLKRLHYVTTMVDATIKTTPGLRSTYKSLSQQILSQRPQISLPPQERAVEMLVRSMLGDQTELSESSLELQARMNSENFDGLKTPRGYKPFHPVPLWLELTDVSFSDAMEEHIPDSDSTSDDTSEKKSYRSRRYKSDLANRLDSFILHKFEAILSWTEFMNLNRRVEDDDADSAKKAAEDFDEISLGQVSNSPATKLKLHLDLAPEDVDREKISGKLLYPEWDARSGSYLKDHVCVLASRAQEIHGHNNFTDDIQARRRIRSVKKQFEILRPGRVTTRGHMEGDSLDMDATVRSQVELQVGGSGTERIWYQTRSEARDLAVSILLDVSRSTESAVSGRSVIEIEREALAALAWGLDACGDAFAINAFSSLKRDRVYLQSCKRFDEPMSSVIENRICGLKPGFYTRLGAALRHATSELAEQLNRRRLILVITDGKPNDLDHYEGSYGIEDTCMAVREARRAGMSVFGITIDKAAKSWFPRLFGQGGFSVIPHPNKLTLALPKIYRQLVCG